MTEPPNEKGAGRIACDPTPVFTKQLQLPASSNSYREQHREAFRSLFYAAAIGTTGEALAAWRRWLKVVTGKAKR